MVFFFTPKRISPYCPVKSNQKLTKISILTPGVQFDSAVCITPRNLTLRWDAHCGA